MRLHAEPPPVAQSDTPAPRFWFTFASGPRREPRPRRRRLYRSPDGRLGSPSSQLDEPHYFGIINAPFSALMSRESIDARSVLAVNKKDEQRCLWGYTAFRPRKCPESADHHNAPARQAATAVFVPRDDFFVVPCACSVGSACEDSWAGIRRVRDRKRSFRVFQYKQLLNEYHRPN